MKTSKLATVFLAGKEFFTGMLEPHSPELPLPPTSSTELPLDRSDSVEETNIIIGELSKEAELRKEEIESLLETCDRATYGENLR